MKISIKPAGGRNGAPGFVVWEERPGHSLAVFTERGLAAYRFGANDPASLERDRDLLWPGARKTAAPDWLKRLQKDLAGYWAGKDVKFSTPLALEGGDFFLKVWRATARIPYGKTLSYGDVAALAGFPRAARAVGSAMRSNPVPILIPCHRVIRRDGELGEYFGHGPAMKRRLLELEGVGFSPSGKPARGERQAIRAGFRCDGGLLEW